MDKLKNTASLRIIDVNFNRAQEGLRVCEELARFVFNSKSSAKDIKALRHSLNSNIRKSKLSLISLIDARNARGDVGKDFPSAKRKSMFNVFSANAQRVKESLRVLEEFLKLFDDRISSQVQKNRFKFYTIEKKIIQRFHTVSCARQKCSG